MNDHDIRPDSDDSPVIAASKGRRRLIGAGVSAAPFLLTLVSQPALGATCFTPSRSLSKNTSLSQAGKDAICTGTRTPLDYQTNDTRQYWPPSIRPSKLMHPLFAMGNSEGVTKFTKADGTSKTLRQALNVSTTMVHSYLIAAYLNKNGGGGAFIPDNILSAADILSMWREYTLKGFYAPFAGTEWHQADIIDYLKSNGIVG